MKLRNLPYLIGQGFVSFWRNGAMTTAAILVLICCMLVLGSFYAIIDNLDNFIEEQTEDIQTINCYVHAATDDEQLLQKKQALAELAESKDSNIVSFVHITKAESLAEMAAQSDELAQVLSGYDETNNPLPETFRIKFKDIDEVHPLMRNLEVIFGGDEIESNIDMYESVSDISSTVTMVGIWLMAILLVIAILIIMNTVKLTVFARRKDIMVMRYIGAKSPFVVTPFIVEGIIVGLVSAIISLGIQYYLYSFVVADILSSYDAINMVPVTEYLPLIPLAFLAVGLFAGVVASAVSVKKHLNV